MQHPELALGDKRICPLTGLQFEQTWSDHSLPGVFNRCEQCSPDQRQSVSEKLHALDRKRENMGLPNLIERITKQATTEPDEYVIEELAKDGADDNVEWIDGLLETERILG